MSKRKKKHSQVPICPKCREPHWRHEPCEKLVIVELPIAGAAANAPNPPAVEYHDFRDTGNPMEKVYPINDWRSWPTRQDDKFDPTRGR